MNIKELSLSALLALGLGMSLASACGGKKTIDFVGKDGGGGDDGNSSGSTRCGDGDIDGDEECDDENPNTGDGCDAACTIEPGFACNGEPSECASTVGNGRIDPGEECDDGNVESDDGCSNTGKIEGSCNAPVLVELKPNSDGTYVGRIESSTSGGGNQLDAADCDGDEVGGGPDRIFQIELPAAVDLRVRVESTFNPIVRVLEAPCDLDEELACENDGGVGAQEDLRISNLAAGTYYIAVDGAQSTQRGDFTLRIEGFCPLENVKLAWLSFYNYDVALTNTSTDCTVNLDGIHLGTVRYSTARSADLPNDSVAPGEQYILSPYSSNYVDHLIDYDDYANPEPSSAGLYLCRGKCDFSNSDNVFDAFFAGTLEPPAPFGDVTFSPDPLSSIDTYYGYLHYERHAFAGSAPDFLASDWRPLLRLDINTGHSYPLTHYTSGTGSAVYTSESDDEAGMVLRFTNAASTSHAGHYLSVPPGLSTPSYLRFRFKSTGGNDNHCWIRIAGNAAPTDFLFSLYLQGPGNTAISYASASTNIGIAPAGEWHTVEFRNIDWSARTFQPYFDNVAGPAGLAMSGSASSVASVYVSNNASGTPVNECLVAEIYMY